MNKSFRSHVACLVLASPATLACAQNVLANPGFEDGLTSWSGTGAVRTGDPLPHGGARYLFGGIAVANAYTFQSLNLATMGVLESQVDAGLVELDYGGWQSGYRTQTDDGKIELKFFDAQALLIGTADLGWFRSASTWVSISGTATLPAGTRSVDFGFYSRRFQGSNCDGYLDDAWLIPTVVPSPSTSVLAAMGGFGLVTRRRR